jgi:hypothetical protein
LVKLCTIFSLRFYHTQRRTVMCPFIKQFGIILAQNSIWRNSISKFTTCCIIVLEIWRLKMHHFLLQIWI